MAQPPADPSIIQIMLVDDDENDVRITRRALRKGGLEAEVIVARDGQEAIDLLRGPDPLRPDLLLIDIQLPKINGIEVLRVIKGDAELSWMPVLMLTTSSRQADVNAAYAHGANGFICKPIEFARFVDVIRTMSAYWSKVARVPTHPRR